MPSPDMNKFLESLFDVWRILIMVIITQLIGGFYGVVAGSHHLIFLNFWHHGALATPVGFVIGLAWHLHKPQRRKHQEKGTICLLAVLTILLPLFVWVVPL